MDTGKRKDLRAKVDITLRALPTQNDVSGTKKHLFWFFSCSCEYDRNAFGQRQTDPSVKLIDTYQQLRFHSVAQKIDEDGNCNKNLKSSRFICPLDR
jgi:hypothetical protein